jgi:hypothetical protein
MAVALARALPNAGGDNVEKAISVKGRSPKSPLQAPEITSLFRVDRGTACLPLRAVPKRRKLRSRRSASRHRLEQKNCRRLPRFAKKTAPQHSQKRRRPT